MKTFFLSVLTLQVICMTIDEFYFHWKRNLPRWERVGHPVDTFFFLIPLGILSFSPSTKAWQIIYILASVVSCLVITKDEAIHRQLSPAIEQWLHSLLFLTHPSLLLAGYLLWLNSELNFSWLFFSVFAFGIYQLIFWNYYADRILASRLRNH